MPPTFLEKIPHEFILMPIMKGQDKPWGVGKGWSHEEASHQCTKDRYIACAYNLKDTPYVVVDLDDPAYTIDQLFEDTGVDSCYVKGNTKGFHVWVELKDKKPTMRRNYQNIGKHTVVDFLGEKVFERVGKEWVGDTACYLTEEQMTKCFHTDKFGPKKKLKLKPFNESLLKLVELIDIQYCDDRADWLKIICAMKHCGFQEEYARAWSMKSDRFTEDGFTTLWNSTQSTQCTEGTLRYYAKLSNPTGYDLTIPMLCDKPTDRDYAVLFWKLSADCCMVTNSTMYLYYKNQWRVEKELHILRTMVGDTIRGYLQTRLLAAEEEAYGKILTILKDICCKFKLNGVVSFVTDMMYSEHCDTEDLFDLKPYIFVFKNQAFDLQTGQPYVVQKEDYITQHTGYDYVPPTIEQLETVKQVFDSIFPDPEVGRCYLSVLRLCLSGEHPEKLFVANGGGRNGKGLLHELMFILLGQYAYKLSIDVLTKDVKKTGANPELANMHKKRMVVSSEPEDGTKIQMGITKEITGCSEISARGLYSADTITRLVCTLIIECNKKLLLSGRMDTSVLERIVDIPFESTFVSNPEDVDEGRGIYQGNTLYKTDAWQKEHACAMFHYILEHADKTLYVPERIKNLSKQYVLGSDEMFSWCMESYEPTDDKVFVKLKDVFDLYKASDLYSNLTKLERRNLNKTAFTELIRHHIVLKKQYRNDNVRLNGKTVNCERIHGLKIRVPEYDTEDEEEAGCQL